MTTTARRLVAIVATIALSLSLSVVAEAGVDNCRPAWKCSSGQTPSPTSTQPPSPSPTATPTTSTPSPSATPAPSPTAAPTATGLTLDDEFSGTSLGAVWGTTSHWTGIGATADRSMLSVANGYLTIQAELVSGQWHSGELDTFGRFSQTYGYFEARMLFTSGRGLWPAFWLAHDWTGDLSELDVDETLANPYPGSCGDNSGSYFATVHLSTGTAPDGAHQYCSGTDLANAWHVYAMDWRSDHVTFLVDGVAWYTYRGTIPTATMPVIFNLALGGWAGPTDSTTPSPSYLRVDWVHVRP